MSAAGYFNLALAAGGEAHLNISARYLSCLAATGDFEIVAEGGEKLFMAAGLSYLAEQGKVFSRLRLTDKSGAANSIQLAFGMGELRDQRLTASGVVTIAPNAGAVFKVEENAPLDVSGAVVPVESASPLDVSGAVVSVESASPLDVSAAVVTTKLSTVFYEDGGVNVLAGASGSMTVPAGAQWADVENQGAESVFIVKYDGATAGTLLRPGETRRISPVGPIVRFYNPSPIAVLCRMTVGY